jgi:predicted ATPase
MNFNLDIENLGNIKKANFEIKPLTVIAGENGSGKSFATKSIYSILDALNKDYITREFISTLSSIKKQFAFFEDNFSSKATVDKNFIERFHNEYDPLLISMFQAYESSDLELQELLSKDFEQKCIEIIEDINSYYKQRETLKKFQTVKEYLDEILKNFERIVDIVKDYKKVVIQGIEKNLDDNFKKNFQVTNLKTLLNGESKSKKIKFDIDSIGNILTDENGILGFSFSSKGIMEIQKLKNIVFIDSPVYLKIRKGLEKNENRFLPKTLDFLNDRYLKGYPLYIEKLYEFLDKKYLDEPDFKELSDELQQLMSGKLNITKTGDIEYINEQGSTVPLSLTAMGISNIGLIDLLLRNNIINKGSFLIIDEPEAHLHPKWQVALVDILYKVAQAGANVIIATHSIDMIKAVELIMKKDEKANELISLNKMPYSEKFSELNEEEKIEEILTDLSSPFYEMYMKGMM